MLGVAMCKGIGVSLLGVAMLGVAMCKGIGVSLLGVAMCKGIGVSLCKGIALFQHKMTETRGFLTSSFSLEMKAF